MLPLLARVVCVCVLCVWWWVGALFEGSAHRTHTPHTLAQKKYTNHPQPPQTKVIVAPRSNNLLDTARIEGEFPQLLGIKESLIKYVFEPAVAD